MHAKQPRDLHPRRTVKVQMTAACILMQLRSPSGRTLTLARDHRDQREEPPCLALHTPKPERGTDMHRSVLPFRPDAYRTRHVVFSFVIESHDRISKYTGKRDFCFLWPTERSRRGHFVCESSQSGFASYLGDHGLPSRSLRLCT